MLAVTVLVFVARQRRYLVTGWLWFLISLVPMLGLIHAGRQAMADRYACVSLIGIFIMVCWGTADLWLMPHRHGASRGQRERREKGLLPAAVFPCVSLLLLLALADVTVHQIGYWKDDLTLWTHAAQVVSNHWEAQDNVGQILLGMGRPEAEVMPHFFRAAEIFPLDPTSNLRVALYQQQHGDLRAAIQHYRNALAGLDNDTQALFTGIWESPIARWGIREKRRNASQCRHRSGNNDEGETV
jgi:hypothetical protein